MRRSRFAWLMVVIGSALSVGSAQVLAAAEAAESSLPPAVDRCLQLLPSDTETIVVAQSFSDSVSKNSPVQIDSDDWSALQAMALLSGKSGDAPASILFVGHRVKVAVMGGRCFETVSSFGAQRFEGCSIVEFENPWLDESVFDALRKEAAEVRKVAEHEVFVFADPTAMEPWFKRKPWQGLFVAVPKASKLLCATSDAYLAEVLERMRHDAPRKRALPPSLPEWKKVDPRAPVWAIRHVPLDKRAGAVSGLTWALKPAGRNVFEATYFPTGHGDARQLIRQHWQPASMSVHPAIEPKQDGTIVVRIDTEKEKPSDWYAFPIYWSQGEQGEQREQDEP